jgi:nanoRNase/pAp phosphatase (c-di-AMP/oligoRNAs hydrolase)
MDELPQEEPQHIVEFKQWVDEVSQKPAGYNQIGILTHKMPDPDAIGAMMGLKWLFDKLGIPSECFYSGSIAHPQNMAMCNLLDPGIIPVEQHNMNDYPNNVVVDCMPNGDNIGANKEIECDVVIDHHKVAPISSFTGVFINLKNGSCCGTIYDIIKSYDFKFKDDNDADSRVATALMVGIAVDTDNLLADSCTEYEFNAYSELFEFRKENALKEIIKYKRPRFWIDRKAEASKQATIDEDGIAVVGVGLLP